MGKVCRELSKIAPCRPGAASTVDSQGKEELDTIRDCLAGRVSEEDVPRAADKAARQLILPELLAAMSTADPSSTTSEAGLSNDAEGVAPAGPATDPGEQQQPNHAGQEQKERARKLFMDHGYFEEAVQELRDGISPQQRADAARALGVVNSKRCTPHLVAAMFDDDPEVRNAAEEALAKLNGPTSNAQADVLVSDRLDLEESEMAETSPFAENIAAQTTSQELKIEDAGELGLNEPAAALPHTTQETGREENQQAASVNKEANRDVHRKALGDAKGSSDVDELLRDEHELREAAKHLEQQIADALSARTDLEKEVILSIERETMFRAEAATRRLKEEELRKRADEEAESRRSNEREALRAERLTRVQAETESERLAEEEARTRLESINLRKAAEELVWRRIGIENARREAAETTRRDEARSSREEADRQHNAELGRLRDEEEALRAATAEAATRRADLQKAHQDTKAELERLTKERVQVAAAEAVRHAEATRLRQEAKTRHEAEVTRLRSESEALLALAEQVSRQRAEVAAAQQQAEGEIERLTKERALLAAA
jgi:hypothetical protein